MVTYTYTSDRTPYTTCQRKIEGKTVYRQKSTSASRRHIRRFGAKGKLQVVSVFDPNPEPPTVVRV